MSIIKKLAGQTMVYGLGTIVPRVLNYLLLTPFYTNIFKQGEYGVVTELYAYLAFLLVLLTYGMETTYFRFSESSKNPDKIYTNSLLSLLFTSVVFIVLVTLFNGQLADAINYPGKEWYLKLLALIVSFDAITAIPFAKLRRENKAKKFAMIKFVNILVNIGLNLYFLVFCRHLLETNPDSIFLTIYDPNIGVGYAFISNLAASVITAVMLFPEFLKLKLKFDFALHKQMLRYAFPLLIVGLAGMVNEVADKILLQFLVEIPGAVTDQLYFVRSQVGIYGANYKMAVLMTLFIMMFKYAAEPFFFAQAKEDNAKQVYADVMKYFIILGLIIFLGVMLYIDVVKHFIGKDFRSGLEVVPIVLLANLCFGIFYNLSVWYKLTNLTKYGAIIALIGAAITLILNILLVPSIGYLGAAWATFFCYFSMMVLSFIWGRKYYPIKYDLKNIFLYTGLALSIFFFTIYFKFSSDFLSYTIRTLLFAAFIFVAGYREGLLKKILRKS